MRASPASSRAGLLVLVASLVSGSWEREVILRDLGESE